MESTKIQEFDLDPNCGFAKEETAQAILGAVGNGMVKSVQRGVISIPAGETSKTATINAVNISKSICLYGGCVNGQGSDDYNAYINLTNSTTVTASRRGIYNKITEVSYEVVEFY